MADFRWDQTKEDAAALVALGELGNQEIADKLDIGIATLFRWKNYQEFQDRVTEQVRAVRDAVMTQEIGDIVKRIRRLNRRWQQIDRLIEERSVAPEMQMVAGGTTGLLCHEQKSIGSGELATVIDVYKFDAALVKEERELAKQAAQECGQWQEKTDITSKGERIGSDFISNYTIDELEAMNAINLKAQLRQASDA